MPNGHPYQSRGEQFGFTWEEYLAGWEEYKRKPFEQATQLERYLYGATEAAPTGYQPLRPTPQESRMVIPGTNMPMPTTFPGGRAGVPEGRTYGFGFPGMTAERIEDVIGGSRLTQEEYDELARLGVDWSLVGQPGARPTLLAQMRAASQYRTSMEAGRLQREQKFLAAQYPKEWGAITAQRPYGDIAEWVTQQPRQEYGFALSRMPEYEELIKRATVEATPTSIWETTLGKLPSFGMQEYFKGQRTPITQAYQAKLGAEERAVPPEIPPTELERGAAFSGFLEEYPFWEEWIQIPRRQRGEYPAQYRPQTRWLGY